MGIADRDYHRTPPQYTSGGMPAQPSRIAGCPVVKWLLIVNITVYFIDMLFFKWFITNWGHFSVDTAVYGGQVWRFLTFQFLHDPHSLMHLLVNSVALFFFGHYVERWWGSRRFLVFYLASGMAGAFLYTILLIIPGLIPSSESWRPMVGASAGIYAILVAVAIIAPNLKVLLYFFIPMSIRTLAIVALCIATYVAFTNGNNAGGEAAHLGGAILGFVFMKFPFLLNFVGERGKKGRRVVDAQVVHERKLRPKISISLEDSEIDRILDKVNREGLQSLTEEERDVLRRVAGQ